MNRSAGYDYSRRAGASVYPVEVGHIFKLRKKFHHHVDEINAIVAHTRYVWVYALGEIPRNDHPRRRACYVISCDVPDLETLKSSCRTWKRKVARDYICNKLLKHGYQIIAKGWRYHHKRTCLQRFYKLIGVMPDQTSLPSE